MSLTSASSTPRSSICEVTLHQIEIGEHYHLVRELGNGVFGKVMLASCKETGTEVALKLLPKSSVTLSDFQREFSYSYYLSPHSAIVNTYAVFFETMEDYVFAQEYAQLGDLFCAIKPNVGLPEAIVKNVIRQLTSALEFMHSKSLVHRDIKPENILVFDRDCSKIKLMDFGMTRKTGIMAKKSFKPSPYTPPEVCEAVSNERCCIEPSIDVWSTGVLIFCALSGKFPWDSADSSDGYFVEFTVWQKRKTVKIPANWRLFTTRGMRLFRRILETNPDKRCRIKEISKYIDDSWIHHTKAHSLDDFEYYCIEERREYMQELSALLKTCGVDTKLTRKFREKRTLDWLNSEF